MCFSNIYYNDIKFVHPKDLDWSKVTEAFISPGIDLKIKSLSKSTTFKTPLYRDLELYSQITKNKNIIAVTGTNGKSTTTALIGHLLNKLGKKAVIGGNIGKPALTLSSMGENGIYVLELSSYQLELISSPTFNLSVDLNGCGLL